MSRSGAPAPRPRLLLRLLFVGITSLLLLQLVSSPLLGPGLPRSVSAPAYGDPPAFARVESTPSSAGAASVPAVVQQAPVGPCAPSNPSAQAFAGNVSVSIDLFSSINQVPALNTVSAYANTVTVTITTGRDAAIGPVPIQQAVLTVWAIGWNNQSLNSTLPSTPADFPMLISPTENYSATGQLNDFKFFPPGSTVYFNITMVQNRTGLEPINWTSPCWDGEVPIYGTPTGVAGIDQPTWVYRITDGWPSPVFENDITITANPNVMAGIEPSPFQAVYFFLNDSKIGFPIGGPLGGARLYYWLENRTPGLHPGGASFCGNNATYVETCYGGITGGVGPFYQPGDIIQFRFLAFVSTSVGIYNKIWSSLYQYVVGSGGTWCQPDSGYQFYGWAGSALPPYRNPSWQNGNFSSTPGNNPDPLTITPNGPLTEVADYTGLGEAGSSGVGGPQTTSAAQVVPSSPGIELPRSAAGTGTGVGPNPRELATTTVTFTESGLPAGAIWSVLLGTTNVSSAKTTIVFTETTGAYAYAVTSPLGEWNQIFVRYVAAPVAGTVSVGSAGVDVAINFTEEVYVDIVQSPQGPGQNYVAPGNITTDPQNWGESAGWFVNNTPITITAIGYFGFDYFLTLTAGHSVPYEMNYVVQSSTNDSIIPAFDGYLNLTLSARNITSAIAYSYVFFNETYLGSPLNGVVLMTEANSTVFYTGDGTQLNILSNLGPFPPGVNVTFYVLAYDELGCPIRSDTYHFHTVASTPPVVDSRTFFYVVVYDQAKNSYVPGVPVNISNNTWWDICYTNDFGFCYPNASFSIVPLYLSYGWYNVTVHYDGQIQSVPYDLSPESNKTLTFIFNSAKQQAPVYAESAPAYSLGLILGMVVVGATSVPIFFVWTEQRRKSAAEEKRITL